MSISYIGYGQSNQDEQHRLAHWREMRQWYLENYQPLFYHWLKLTGNLEISLLLTAERAEQLYQQKMSILEDEVHMTAMSFVDATEHLCFSSQLFHSTCAEVEQEVLFERAPQRKVG